MKPHPHPKLRMVLITAAMVLSAAAQAQSSNVSGAASGSSWYNPSGSRYFGLNVGRSNYAGNCGLGAFTCEDTATAYNVYSGSMWNKNVGLELGLADFGKIDRNGGTTKAYGFSAKAVGVMPLSESVSGFAKLGTLFGKTKVTADSGSGVATGSDDGWGASYGLGLSLDITPQLAGVLEWEQSHMKFAGNRDHINFTSVGLKYRF